MKKTTFLIVGKHAVLEALKNPSRKIERVFLTEDAQKKLNKVDQVDDKEMIDLVEEEIKDLLTSYKFPGDKTPIIKGSALAAVEGLSLIHI